MEVASEIISELSSRSKRLRCGAYCILAAILCLIVIGIYVFRTAQEITSADLNGDVSKSISVNNIEITALSNENQAYIEYRNGIIGSLRPKIAGIFHTYTRQASGIGEISIRFDQVPVEQLTNNYMSGLIKIVADQQKTDPFTAWVVFYQEIGFYNLTKSQWLSISADFASTKFDIPYDALKSNAAKNESNLIRINFLTNVNKVLQDRLVNIAAGLDTGKSDQSGDNRSDPIFRLLQTNFTRFGTLAVITFLITIFIPLYRYNMRLSAFYLARSDALRLCAAATDKMSFEATVSALSPSIDFGKTPTTPIEQIINFVRATSRAEKD